MATETHAATPGMTVDPFTVEIIKDGLIAAGDEMFYALQRTAKSTIIYEVLDYATGLLDARGQLLTQGNGVAGFLGTLTFAVKYVLEKFGEEALHPGDIIILNDPYVGGGTHLSDVSLIMPIFYEGQLVAFSANKAHWTEVGGKDPGSWTTDATEVYQEGLQFPAVKIFEAGTPNQAVVDIIAANVRTPDMSIGDMLAGVAALRVGERRTQELFRKYGKDTVLHAMAELLDYGERMARLELQRLPKGTYDAVDYIDDDGIGNGPFEVRVKVTITDDAFICDFTGSSGQVPGPVNCGTTGLHSAVRAAWKAVTDPGIPANEGVFRPLRVICPPRTIFTAEKPAPVSTYWETMLYATDLVWKALDIVDGGAGEYRGGRGLVRDYHITSEWAGVTATFGRHKFLPWGMNGGQDGSRNYVEFIHDDGRREVLGKCARYMLKKGEVARLHTATGGGYGPASRRPKEQVLQDLKEGYITPEQAARDYGVAGG